MIDMTPMRLQICCYNTLVAEVIIHHKDMDRTWAAYARSKYNKGMPMGGALMQRADLPRVWNVPVGSDIKEGD